MWTVKNVRGRRWSIFKKTEVGNGPIFIIKSLKQCDQSWLNLATLTKKLVIFGKKLRVFLVFGKVLNTLCNNFYALWQIFISVNGQIQIIWSHWTLKPRGRQMSGAEMSALTARVIIK